MVYLPFSAVSKAKERKIHKYLENRRIFAYDLLYTLFAATLLDLLFGPNSLTQDEFIDAVIDTPATFETPVAYLEPGTPLHDDEKSKDIRRNKEEPKLSLDESVATHTSEDNESFQEIMNNAFERHKKRV
ncbi:hypothetical protein QYM36_011975 [Artemia franciscana]|uniref:Uncharacterized protein n=1 Tax=Artemia franciscana TaxID=6661 RepID=A0AA88HMY3_ARTSF|nr:hypothetical protein QYM36_011975 [Artemia franciscana]